LIVLSIVVVSQQAYRRRLRFFDDRSWNRQPTPARRVQEARQSLHGIKALIYHVFLYFGGTANMDEYLALPCDR
jgi:hypothetical protein